MRPLSLHVSALNDTEYSLFTSCLADLAAQDSPSNGDIHYEKLAVTPREVRAWLRGRYPDLPLHELDAVLQLFDPSPLQEPVLSGDQFFAILRLVLHIRNGAELDRNLVFAQVHPTLSKTRSQSPNKRPPPRPAPHRPRQPFSETTFDVPTSDTNPFHHLADRQPPPPPSALPERRPSPPAVRVHVRHASNPFLSRAKTIHTTTSPVVVLPAGDTTAFPERKPPLPPRKQPPVIPPRSAFLYPGNAPGLAATTHHAKPPPPPVAPKVPHLTTALMKTSLQASKAAQNAKKAEAERESARVLQVLKSSSTNSRSRSPAHDGGVIRRTASRTASISSSSEDRPPPPRTP
ncbi:hypothetical protein EW146_g5416, partial [Bondarzewia mesenterica]